MNAKSIYIELEDLWDIGGEGVVMVKIGSEWAAFDATGSGGEETTEVWLGAEYDWVRTHCAEWRRVTILKR